MNLEATLSIICELIIILFKKHIFLLYLLSIYDVMLNNKIKMVKKIHFDGRSFYLQTTDLRCNTNLSYIN